MGGRQVEETPAILFLSGMNGVVPTVLRRLRKTKTDPPSEIVQGWSSLGPSIPGVRRPVALLSIVNGFPCLGDAGHIPFC
jgi:hypothetical protein